MKRTVGRNGIEKVLFRWRACASGRDGHVKESLARRGWFPGADLRGWRTRKGLGIMKGLGKSDTAAAPSNPSGRVIVKVFGTQELVSE